MGRLQAPQADSPFWTLARGATGAHVAIFKLTGGRIGGRALGADVVLLEHVGRKSGKHRTHPLLCLRDGDDVVIVASKGGVDKHPAWYHNLMADPETTIHLRGGKRRVRAREADAGERERLWPLVVEMYSDYADYQARTERQIPLVILEPVP